MLFSLISITSETCSNLVKAISQALSKPSTTFNGCKPLSINFKASSNKAPANTTTPVVPSPISLSYELDNSRSNLAVGCSISISDKIVAPSLVTNTSLSGDTIILSKPFGPNDVFKVLATDLAA